MKLPLFNILRYTIGILFLTFLAWLMLSCKSSQVPMVVQQQATHTELKDSTNSKYHRDSIFVDRWHTIYTKGDTVYIHDSIFLFKGKEANDTIYIKVTTTDTIPAEPVIIEKQPTKNDIFLRRSGIALWVILALLLLSVIVGIVLKFAK